MCLVWFVMCALGLLCNVCDDLTVLSFACMYSGTNECIVCYLQDCWFSCGVVPTCGWTLPLLWVKWRHTFRTAQSCNPLNCTVLPAVLLCTAARYSLPSVLCCTALRCRENQALLASGWGDEEGGVGPLNPHYDPELYQEYDEVRS